jgi:uncharacterized protein
MGPVLRARDAVGLTISHVVGRLIAAVVRACGRRPLTTTLVSVLLAAAAGLYAAHNLAFVTSAVRLLPQHARYVVLLKEYLKDFGAMQGIVVAVEAPRPEVAKAYATRLAGEIGKGGLAANVTYRVDPAYFKKRGLLYLAVEDLTTLRDRLLDYRDFVESYAERPTLARLLEGLDQQLGQSMAVGLFDIGLDGRQEADLTFIRSVLGQALAALDGRAPYRSPWSTAFSLGRLDDPDAGYFFSGDDRFLFVFVEEPREGDLDVPTMIRTIRVAIGRLTREFPTVQAGVTGSSAISNDEMATAFNDSKTATVLAFAVTLALMLLAFRRVGAPLLMLAALAVSLVWSLGLIALVVGQLNIFSVMFISIVVGIGIDYGIYLLYRYDEERSLGAAPADALSRSAERGGPGMLLSALTAAGTFMVLILTDFQGIREFGLISGIAILAAFLSMITLFPALLSLVDRGQQRGGQPSPSGGGEEEEEARWLARLTRYRKTLLGAAAVLSALSIWGAFGVEFSYNMLKLQARGTESVVWEERILSAGGGSGFAAVTTASGMEELRRKQEALAALPSVAKVDSILKVVPDRQGEKIPIIRQLAPLLASVRMGKPPVFEADSLRQSLIDLRRRLGILAREAADQKIGPDLLTALRTADALSARLEITDPTAIAAALGPLQVEIARDFDDKLRTFRGSLRPRPIVVEELPRELWERYVGNSGRFLIRIEPAVDIWERSGAERFVHDIRSVDVDVTGPPVTSFEAIRLIRRGYLLGSLYALILVAAVAAATFWSARGTALALVPLVLGVLWTLGLMRVCDLRFNLANVWALPLIIGTAAEFGLNIYVRALQARESGGPMLGRSTVMAVVLNGCTTMGGFASLMVASHRGIFGLGLLLTIGMAATLFASLAVLTVLIHLLASPTPRAAVEPTG